MIFIAHRINTINELKNIPFSYGVEVDIRDKDQRLILQHDPFKNGEFFDEYLCHYHHAFIILNIKSERIELRVLELLKQHAITNYFFLDSSFPMIYQLSQQGEFNSALRFSEYEGIDTIYLMQNRVRWVWVDCFSYLPLTQKIFSQIKAMNLKICLVSPELQGHENDIEHYKTYLHKNNIVCDAICTKIYNISRWQDISFKATQGCSNK
jgi:hypothetical protein